MTYMVVKEPKNKTRPVIQIRHETAPELGRRFKAMAAMMGMPGHEYLTFLLDQEESRQRRRRAQMPSPLHMPTSPPTEDEL